MDAKRILVAEDDEEIRLALVDVLAEAGYEVVHVPDGPSALRELELGTPGVVLTDVRMPGMDGIELCQRLRDAVPSVPVVVMTAFGDVESAVGALRAGACDFITKPLEIDQLKGILARAFASTRTGRAITPLPPFHAEGSEIPSLIGSSEAMQRIREQIARAAATESTVLVTGESGTGKELVARALHDSSARSKGPFVAISCAAVPNEILESELFGYEKGAFTGAHDARAGLLADARGGTLFLDEIGDMPLPLQPKLLRVLDERRVRPLGSAREVEVDARIVAATNRPLERAVEVGEFRQELYFRINVLHIALPPLRERGNDVIELARWLLAQGSTDSTEYVLATEAEKLLLAYGFPGNVRELQNCMSAAMALASGGRIGFEELPSVVRRPRAFGRSVESTTLADVERQHIEIVLEALGGNKADAARTLGIDRATLYRKLKRLGLSGPR